MTHGDVDKLGYDDLLRAQQELRRIINALAKLSAMQLQTTGEYAWQEVLDRKSVLLGEIEARHFGELTKRSKWSVRELQQRGRHEEADLLAKLTEENVARLREIMNTESAAEHVLKEQIHAIRHQLSQVNQGRQARNAYSHSRCEPENTLPRFLNSEQ